MTHTTAQPPVGQASDPAATPAPTTPSGAHAQPAPSGSPAPPANNHAKRLLAAIQPHATRDQPALHRPHLQPHHPLLGALALDHRLVADPAAAHPATLALDDEDEDDEDDGFIWDDEDDNFDETDDLDEGFDFTDDDDDDFLDDDDEDEDL